MITLLFVLLAAGAVKILVTLLIAAAIFYVLILLVGMIPVPKPLKTIAYIILFLILVLYLLNYLDIYSFKW